MILVISTSKKNARALSDMFYYMGILASGHTPTEALSEISTAYRAVIVLNPATLPDKRDFLQRIRSYTLSVPCFAVTSEPDEIDRMIFDDVLGGSVYAPKIYSKIIEYSEAHRLPKPGKYKIAGIDASCDLSTSTYFTHSLKFTRTENMILRAMIRIYPNPMRAKEILKYAFRPSKLPDISNIRTHISVMNKKFREITERNLIILEPGKGYLILTPEIMELKA